MKLILKFIAPLPGIDQVYIAAGGEFFHAIEADKQMIILKEESRFHSKVEGLDKGIGINDFPLLKAVLEHPNYIDCTAKIIKTEYGGRVISLTASNGDVNTIPVYSEEFCKENYKIPPLMPGVVWGAEFDVAVATVDNLRYWLKAAGDTSKNRVMIYTNKSMRVRGRFGYASFEVCTFTLSETCSAAITKNYWFSADLLLKLISYRSSADNVKVVFFGIQEPASAMKVVIEDEDITVAAVIFGMEGGRLDDSDGGTPVVVEPRESISDAETLQGIIEKMRKWGFMTGRKVPE